MECIDKTMAFHPSPTQATPTLTAWLPSPEQPNPDPVPIFKRDGGCFSHSPIWIEQLNKITCLHFTFMQRVVIIIIHQLCYLMHKFIADNWAANARHASFIKTLTCEHNDLIIIPYFTAKTECSPNYVKYSRSKSVSCWSAKCNWLIKHQCLLPKRYANAL